jgi:hypothetical protein
VSCGQLQSQNKKPPNQVAGAWPWPRNVSAHKQLLTAQKCDGGQGFSGVWSSRFQFRTGAVPRFDNGFLAVEF